MSPRNAGLFSGARRSFACFFLWIALAALVRGQAPDRFSKPLTVPTPTDNYPHSFVGDKGKPEGFVVELLDAVARVMEMKLNRVPDLSGDYKPGLQTGQYDILQTYSFDPSREAQVAFSSSYLEMQGAIFINRRLTKIKSVEELDAGHSIAIVGPGSPGDRFVRKSLPNAKIVYAGGGEAALRSLQAGEYDAVFLTRFTGLPVIDRFKMNDIIPFGPPISGYSVKFCFAVRRDDTELLTRLNEGLAILHRTGEFDELYQKWFGRYETRRFTQYEVVQIVVGTLVVGLALALWALWRQGLLRRRLAAQASELAESRALLAEAQALAHLGHWRRLLAEPKTITWSEETYRIHERDPHLGPFRTIEELTSSARPEDAVRWRTEVERAMRENHAYEIELAIEPRPGLHKYIHVRGHSSRDSNGRILGVFGTVQDITARRAAELAQQESEQLLRALYENLPNALGVLERVGEEWRFVSLNPEALRLAGMTAIPSREMPALSPELPLSSQPWWSELLGRAAKAEHPVTFELQREDLHRSFAVTLVPLRASTGRARCCFLIQDTTERRLRDAEIAQGRRLRAIGEMVGGIAHEFNNLLTPIVLKSNQLAAELSNSPFAADHRLIAETARRAADLTRRLLAFGRKTDAQPEIVRLREVVEGNLDLLRHTSDRRIRFSNTIPDAFPVLQLKVGDLNQIVLNLLLNARDTLEEKLGEAHDPFWVPEIAIEAVSLPGSAAEPLDPSSHPRPDQWLRFTVRDTGKGMSRAVLERIFEPFYSTKPVGRGTGLGLATVWHLAVGLGGRIEVESTEGQGTSFLVYLPVRVALISPPKPKDASRSPFTRTTVRVLLAEDEEAIAVVLRTLLTRDGHSVTVAANGREAWEKFSTGKGAFDVLIFDLNMPELTGIEFARRVRTEGNYPGAMLVMSGRVSEAMARELAELEVDEIIEKPFTLDVIRAALSRMLPKV